MRTGTQALLATSIGLLVSAGPNNGLPFPGNLYSTPNRRGDEPWNNIISGMVNTPIHDSGVACGVISDKSFVEGLLLAESGYQPIFKYEFHPTYKTEGFNSNSFITGILDAVGAAVTLPDISIPGAQKPVPNWGFGYMHKHLNFEFKAPSDEMLAP